MKEILLFLALFSSLTSPGTDVQATAKNITDEIILQYETLEEPNELFFRIEYPDIDNPVPHALDVVASITDYVYGVTPVTPGLYYKGNVQGVKVTIRKPDIEDRQEFKDVITALVDKAKTKETQVEQILVLKEYLLSNGFEYDHEYVEKYTYINRSNIVDCDSCMPDGVILTNKGICLGYANLVAVFCDELGIRNIKLTGVPAWSTDGHIWNFVELDGDWFVVDATFAVDTNQFIYYPELYAEEIGLELSEEYINSIIEMKYGERVYSIPEFPEGLTNVVINIFNLTME